MEEKWLQPIILLPLEGIEIEDIGVLKLGTSKEAVHKMLGKPTEHDDHSWVFMKYEFRLDFDEEGNIEFIEFIFGPTPEKIVLSLYEQNPFELEAADLVALLTKCNRGAAIDDSDAPYCYTFAHLAMGVWRQFSDADVQQSIDETPVEDQDAEDDEWLARDLEMGKHFWTIGLGVAGYYG